MPQERPDWYILVVLSTLGRYVVGRYLYEKQESALDSLLVLNLPFVSFFLAVLSIYE